MKSESIEQTYKKVTQVQHILLRPDTYIGSTQSIEDNMWILQDQKMVFKKIRYVPGLYKIFDEILVNAADNYQRDRKMTKIDVKICQNGTITVINDGKTIPVQIHKQHSIYVAQLIFGHLLTSSNYNDQQKKITGGRNGFGAKLANIFSSSFLIQTADSINKKLLKLQWSNNMKLMKDPILKNFQGKDFTKIQFTPDFKKFGLIQGFTNDIMNLFKKRVYDLAGILAVKVYLNDELVNVHSFLDYVQLHNPQITELIRDPQSDSSRWKVVIVPSQGQFQQISFVNSICTIKGGTHVNYICDQIVNQLIPILKKKAKDITIKPFQIKSQIKVFINCFIQNPSFDSQTKQTLTTNSSQFGSQYIVSQKLIRQINKSGITDKILSLVRIKQNNKIDRNLKKIKNTKLVISKLQDANFAGKHPNCTLILTQGDSAKALAMSGIQKLGRDYFGVFPLRGKPVNVRQLTTKQVMENMELSNIVKIVGLHFGKTYQDTKSLRYSSIMIMADQDTDGSHIKGLIINFFQTFWPSLCKIPGFLKQFITPIVRCKRGAEKIDFFSQTDFRNWKRQTQTQWKVKYYKGLGTSTNAQAEQYFSNLQKHQIKFNFIDVKDHQMIDLVFLKKNTDARKKWLQQYNPNKAVNYSIKNLKVQDFINQEFIHFSIADNVRSIPSLIDGLKPSQRKILFACFKRNLRNEIKVAQLAGYVAEHSAYHHGQQSLCSTIIGMAQDFIGSNNLNLLLPIGQFGTRHMLGKDSASPRYIYTALNPLTRYLFPQADDHIVQYQQEDSMHIEPKYYYPILPLVLINGSQGIGTGWSTTLYPHLVQDVIDLIRDRIKRKYKVISIGWQKFKGTIQFQKKGVYSAHGNYQIDGDTVTINQIPPNKSIQQYKSYLQDKLRTVDNPDPQLEQVRQYHMGDHIQFVIRFVDGKQPIDQQLEKYLKLKTQILTSNMTLFDQKQKIKRYQSLADIVQEYFQCRLLAYTKRKQYLISKFQRQYQIVQAKINFIDRVVQGKFRMMDNRQGWIQQLASNKYPKFHQLTQVKSTKKQQNQQNEDENKQYNYLLVMPIWNFCQQKIKELKIIRDQIKTLLQYYSNTTQHQMWIKDLDQFQNLWKQFKQNNNLKINNKKKNKRGTNNTNQIQEQQEQDINQEQQVIEITKKKKKNQGKNNIKNQVKNNIIQLDTKQNTRKKIKKNQIIEIPQMNIQTVNQNKNNNKMDNNNFQDLLSKYMKPNANGDELSLQDRIKARLNKYDQAFNSSYKSAKNGQPQNDFLDDIIQGDEDWL